MQKYTGPPRAFRRAPPSSLTASWPMPTRSAFRSPPASRRAPDRPGRQRRRGARSRPPPWRSLHGRTRHRGAHAFVRTETLAPRRRRARRTIPSSPASPASTPAGRSPSRSFGFFALGSGPARALSRVEELFKELGYVDHYPQASACDRRRQGPAAGGRQQVPQRCGVHPDRPHDHVRNDREPRRHGADRRPRARSRDPQSPRAPLPAREHSRTAPARRRSLRPSPISSRPWAARTTPSSMAAASISSSEARTSRCRNWLADSLPSSTARPTASRSPRSSPTSRATSTKSIRCCSHPLEVIVSNVETGNSFRAGELAPEIVDASFR